MKPINNFFSRLCTRVLVFCELLFFQVIVLLRCAFPGSVIVSSGKLFHVIATQYLNLIEEKNPTIRYSRKRSQHQSVECSVCLSEFLEGERVRRLSGCKHEFHKDCLDRWLQYLATCPLCRCKVLPDEIVENYQQLQNQIVNGATRSYDDTIILMSALFGDSLRRFF